MFQNLLLFLILSVVVEEYQAHHDRSGIETREVLQGDYPNSFDRRFPQESFNEPYYEMSADQAGSNLEDDPSYVEDNGPMYYALPLDEVKYKRDQNRIAEERGLPWNAHREKERSVREEVYDAVNKKLHGDSLSAGRQFFGSKRTVGVLPNKASKENISVDIDQRKIILESHAHIFNIKPSSSILIKPETVVSLKDPTKFGTSILIVPEEPSIDQATNDILKNVSFGESVTSSAFTEQSVTDQSVTNQSVTNQSVTNQSVTNQDVIDQNVTNLSVTNQNVIDQNVTDQSVTNQNVIDQSVTNRSEVAMNKSLPTVVPEIATPFIGEKAREIILKTIIEEQDTKEVTRNRSIATPEKGIREERPNVDVQDRDVWTPPRFSGNPDLIWSRGSQFHFGDGGSVVRNKRSSMSGKKQKRYKKSSLKFPTATVMPERATSSTMPLDAVAIADKETLKEMKISLPRTGVEKREELFDSLR